jgi:uncharacterized repeat protein (TIGR03803 family)
VAAQLTTLLSFNVSNGEEPRGTLIADANGDLFGTTELGGANGDGTVFEIQNTGTVAAPVYASAPTTLVSFNGTNGSEPIAGLTTDAHGDLFGTTFGGGANSVGTAWSGDGMVFEIQNTGTVAAPVYASAPTTLVSFNGSNGANPVAGLIADANGDLFGTTIHGGANSDGTVFEIQNTGTVAAPVYASAPTTLASFNGTNGTEPYAGLTMDANGDLFGTTFGGGANSDGTVFEIQNTGTVAAPVYASAPTTLVSFNGFNGQTPQALIADANGDLFGTTVDGGANSDGTMFEIKNAGTVAAPVYASAPTTLINFNGPNEVGASVGLIADANGDLFGTTSSGYGAYSGGTVFGIKNTGTVAAPVYASAPTTLVSFNGPYGQYPNAGLTIDANGDLFGTTELGGANSDGTVFEVTGISFTTGAVPTIAGTVAGQTTTMEAPLDPFAKATIGDRNAGAIDTLTITLGGAGSGTLADGAGFSGLKTGGGAYALSGTASAITSELEALVFTPKGAWPGSHATTKFTLSDVSSAGGAPAVNSTTSVIDNDPSGAISVSAAYLAANIDGINRASQVSSITLTDSGIPQLNVTDAQAAGDTVAFNKITNEVFELLAPGMASTYYVGGNGATGPALSFTASNSALVERAASNVVLAGSNDTVKLATGSNLSVSGSTDAITATTGDAITINSGTGETIKGSGFNVSAAIGTAFAVGGNGISGTLDQVVGSGASVTVQAASNVGLTGSNDSVTMGAGSNLIVSGSTNTISATAGDKIAISAGTDDAITGSGFTVNGTAGTEFAVGGNGVSGTLDQVVGSGASVTVQAASRVHLTGSNDSVTTSAGSNLTVSGSTNTISATTGDAIWLNSGPGDTITGSGFTVRPNSGIAFAVGGNGVSGALDQVIGAGASVTVQANSNVGLTGSNDSVTMGAGSNLSVSGYTDSITATTGDGITISSGTGETITGSGFTVHAGKGTGFTLMGTADVVYAGLNDAITDSGSSTTFRINSNVGNLALSGFGADTSGIIDLLNGAGGYTNASQAFAALTSDGAGGSKLSLGADGSIDFVNVAPSSLHASNFKIG